MAAVTALISKYQIRSGTRYRVRITNRRFRADGASFDRAGFKTRREAEAYAKTMREKVAALEQGQVELGATLLELVSRYQDQALPQLNAIDRRRRRAQLSWWLEFLGADTRLADVTARQVTEGLRALATKPRASAPRGKLQKAQPNTPSVSPATVNRYRAALSAVFTFAIKDLHWINQNPVQRTRIAKEARGRVRWLEPEELHRLGRCVDKQPGHLPLMFWVAVSTGARLGEILSARWGQVRFTNEGATLTLEDTKNGESRVLPIVLPKAVQLLRSQKLRYRTESEFLIPPENNGKKHHRWRKAWKAAQEAAGISDFRFHDLRHTFASHCAMQGQDAIQIADLTGHKSLAMVRRYAHLNPRSRRDNARAALNNMQLLTDNLVGAPASTNGGKSE